MHFTFENYISTPLRSHSEFTVLVPHLIYLNLKRFSNNPVMVCVHTNHIKGLQLTRSMAFSSVTGVSNTLHMMKPSTIQEMTNVS